MTGIATVTSLGGKRWASGTVQAGTATELFTYNTPTPLYPVQVSGLSFKPRYIFLLVEGRQDSTVFNGDHISMHPLGSFLYMDFSIILVLMELKLMFKVVDLDLELTIQEQLTGLQ